MVDKALQVPEYSPVAGLKFDWEDGFIINVSVDSSEVVMRANRSGLISLARHLLTLAQAEVTAGAHVHLTAGQEIDGDYDLILQLDDDASLLSPREEVGS